MSLPFNFDLLDEDGTVLQTMAFRSWIHPRDEKEYRDRIISTLNEWAECYAQQENGTLKPMRKIEPIPQSLTQIRFKICCSKDDQFHYMKIGRKAPTEGK